MVADGWKADGPRRRLARARSGKYGGHMKDEELSDDWPGEPVSVRSLMEVDGKLTASVDGKPVDPPAVPDLVAALARSKERDRDS